MPASSRTLADLEPGDTGTVVRMDDRLPADERRRLLEIGFFPGTSVQAVMASPLGNPVAYLVRGMTVALRRSQADKIEVRDDG